MGFLCAGVLIQVCFAVAALIGVGVVCFALTRAGLPFQAGQEPTPTPSELLHRVI